MQTRKEQNGYWLILQKGEEIKSTIEGWAKQNDIKGAKIWGIGGVKDITLGYFNTQTKKYQDSNYEQMHELVSCMGNLNSDGAHLHIMIAGPDNIVRGGHLQKATIAIVGEFFVMPTKDLNKMPLEEFSLKKIDLEK